MNWRSLSPLHAYLDYRRARDLAADRRVEFERLERREALELQRDLIKGMTGMVETAFAASTAQTTAFHAFLDSFKVTDQPRVREWDEDEHNRRYLERRTGAALPDELVGLDKIEQFSALIDKMDAFERG